MFQCSHEDCHACHAKRQKEDYIKYKWILFKRALKQIVIIKFINEFCGIHYTPILIIEIPSNESKSKHDAP